MAKDGDGIFRDARIPGDGVDDATRARRAMRRHHVAVVLQGEGREDVFVLAVAASVVLAIVHAVAGVDLPVVVGGCGCGCDFRHVEELGRDGGVDILQPCRRFVHVIERGQGDVRGQALERGMPRRSHENARAGLHDGFPSLHGNLSGVAGTQADDEDLGRRGFALHHEFAGLLGIRRVCRADDRGGTGCPAEETGTRRDRGCLTRERAHRHCD